MSTKEQPPPPPPKLVKLNKAFKLAEQWVSNMTGDAEDEAEETEMEGRPSRLGLGAKVPRRSQNGPLNDPVERKLHKKLEIGRRKAAGDEGSTPSAKNEPDFDSDDSENLESRTNAFAKKRAAPQTTTPQAKKKPK